MTMIEEITLPDMTGVSHRWQLLRTAHLGIGFLLIFSADNTRTNVQKLFYGSIQEDDPTYSVDGYVSLGLIYVVFGLALLVAPTVIHFIGPRVAMTIGVAMMTCFLFLLTLENVWATYCGIFLTGVGGSFVWVGQGNYLVLNSEPTKHGIHVSLFWAIYTISTMLGNIYAAASFAGKSRLDYATRRSLVLSMFGVGVAATVVFAALRPPKRNTPLDMKKDTAYRTFRRTIRIYMSREFLTLTTAFCFMGFQQSFGWGVLSSCVGFTSSFGSFATELAPLTAAVYGAGGTLGGAIHAVAPYLQLRLIRRYVFGAGYILQLVALVGIFVNLPNASVFGYTDDKPYLQEPIVWLTCACSFLMGIGDSFYNTQLYPLLANLYPEASAHTVAIYKFTKSMAMAVFYFASIALGLYAQVIIMAVTGFFGVLCFYVVDLKVDSKKERVEDCNKTT